MLALAWATLPDLPTYRTGIILVGLARCIAMVRPVAASSSCRARSLTPPPPLLPSPPQVMIWSHLAHGDADYCAILVIINSVLQIVLFSPMSVFFINVIGGESGDSGIKLEYGRTAIAVLIVRREAVSHPRGLTTD